jgi:hypothetical protein
MSRRTLLALVLTLGCTRAQVQDAEAQPKQAPPNQAQPVVPKGQGTVMSDDVIKKHLETKGVPNAATLELKKEVEPIYREEKTAPVVFYVAIDKTPKLAEGKDYPRYWVAVDTKSNTVLYKDPRALGALLRAHGLVDKPDAIAPADVIFAWGRLVRGGQVSIATEAFQSRDKAIGALLGPATATKEPSGGVKIVGWTSNGRGVQLERQTILVSPTYEITVTTEAGADVVARQQARP